MNQARFEIVRTDGDQPWHARFRASNGELRWTTETYTRREAARDAIDGLVAEFGAVLTGDGIVASATLPVIEVRDVDERTVT